MRQILLYLALILIIVLLPSLVNATGCCIPQSTLDPLAPGAAERLYTCFDENENFQDKVVLQEICEDPDVMGGVWSDKPCAEETACEIGCCCDAYDPTTFTGLRGGLDTTSNVCDRTPEKSFILNTDGVSCNDLCLGIIDFYDLTGTITKNGDIQAGAKVSARTAAQTFQRIDADDYGTYTMNLPGDLRYIIRAEKDGCWGEAEVLLSENKLVTIEISQCANDPCIPSIWNCDWEDDVQECGYASSCVQENAEVTNLCTPAQPPKPIYVPCPEQTTCGDGNKDEGEECDGTDIDEQTCSDLGYDNIAGNDPVVDSCTNNCKLDTRACVSCPQTFQTNLFSCTQEQCDNGCAACQDAGYCTNNCNDLSTTLFTVNATPEAPTAQLRWKYAEADCAQNIDYVIIEQFQGDGESSDCETNTHSHNNLTVDLASIEQDNTWTDPRELIPSTLNNEIQYCYTIYTITTQEDGSSKTTQGPTTSLISGNELCMQEHTEQLCAQGNQVIKGHEPPEEEIRTSCDDTNRLEILEACGTENRCVGPYEDETTVCSSEEICGFCNGLFGMYSYLGSLQVPYYEVIDEVYVEIPDGKMCSELGESCYQDTSLTISDEYKSCGNINSCYDYNKENCEENPCLIEGMGECAWKGAGLYGEELGIGACRPVLDKKSGEIDVERQDCRRCNDEGNICTQELCSIHGKECVYLDSDILSKKGFEEGQCLEIDEAACEFYTSEEDCNGGKDASTNTTYNENGNRVNGSNWLDRSNDKYGLGTCRWSTQELKCYKDADGKITSENVLGDCYGTADFSCYQDHQAPTTTLTLKETNTKWADKPVYGIGDELSFVVSAEDNRDQTRDIKTYFILKPQEHYEMLMTNFPAPEQAYQLTASEACTQLDPQAKCGDIYYACDDGDWKKVSVQSSCDEELQSTGHEAQKEHCAWKTKCATSTQEFYPLYTLEELKRKQYASGEYTLMYYSEDRSKNLEVVNSTELILDATAPEMKNWSISIASYQASDKSYKQNITLRFDIHEEYGFASCQARLESILPVGPGDIEGSGTRFEQTYEGLEDGEYEHIVSCQDLNGNEETYTKKIYLEADKNIYNVYPRFNVTQENTILIEFNTTNKGECYLSADNPELISKPQDGTRTKMDTTGNYGHQHIYEIPPNTYINQLYTGCTFTEADAEVPKVEGNYGDLVIFGHDVLGPTTQILREGDTKPYEAREWVEEEDILFSCTDKSPQLLYGNKYLIFGKDKIYYCIGENCNPNVQWNGDAVHIEGRANTGNKGEILKYYCEDKGGNREATKTSILHVKDLTFKAPEVQVCDREGTCTIASGG